MQETIISGVGVIGGDPSKQPFGSYQFLQKDMINTEQGNPLPVLWGTDKLSGTSMTPIWDFTATQINSGKKGGSGGGGKGGGGGTPQYQYNGSYALAIMMGPCDILHAILDGTTPIWIGPIFRTAADGQGKTVLTTSAGVINFWWGESNQGLDALFAGLTLNGGAALMPNYRNVVFATGDALNFGQSTTPLTLTFIVSRFPSGLLTWDPGCSRITMTGYGTNYGTIPTVVITGGGGSGASAVAEMDTAMFNMMVITPSTNTGKGGAPPNDPTEYVIAGAVTDVEMVTVGSAFTGSPTVSFTGGGGSGATAVATLYQEIDGDCNVADIIYDLLTNTLYGAGLDPSLIDSTSFAACAVILGSERMGCSVLLDSASTLRETLGKLFQIAAVFPYFHNGKIYLQAVRYNEPPSSTAIGMGDLIEEAMTKNKGTDATWNFTQITYRDFDNFFTDGVASYLDVQNEDIVGQRITKNQNFPWLTNHATASMVAKRVGITGGIPTVEWNLKLKPLWNTLLPGALLSLTTTGPRAVTGKLLRVSAVHIGGPEQPNIEIEAVEDTTRSPANDYVIPADPVPYSTVNTDGTPNFPAGNTTPYLSWIPTGLLNPSSPPDGVMVCMNRPNDYTTGAAVYLTWEDPGATYQAIGTTTSFPAFAQVLWWQPIRDNSFLLRVVIANEADLTYLDSIKDQSQDIFIAMGQRIVKTVGTPAASQRMTACVGLLTISGIFATFNSDTFDIEITAGAWSTPGLLLESLSTAMTSPTLNAFIGLQADFLVAGFTAFNFQRDAGNATSDTNRYRYVKAATVTGTTLQSVAGLTANVYERDNTAMGQDGTTTTAWGDRAMTASELLDLAGGSQALGKTDASYADVTDLDDALGAIYWGIDNPTQDVYAAHLDNCLGYMIGTGQLYYSETP